MHTKAGKQTLTIAALGSKGGVGKTTLATNLAAAAHLTGHHTLLVDCDQQASALDWFAARAEGSRLAGLTVVRADKALSLPKFRDMSRGYEVTILDGPPRLGDVTRAAAVAADVVLLPIRPGAFDYWSLAETVGLLDMADSIREQLGMGPVVRLLVVNGAPVRGRNVAFTLDAVTGAVPVAPVVVGSRVAYAMASVGGESVLTVAEGSAAAEEVRRLWDAVVGVARGEEARDVGR